MTIDTSFLKHLDRMALIINKRLTSNYVGERASMAGGSGLVLKDYAQYVPGDDFRRIDWRVFARTDRLYIKRMEEERNLTIHIVIDFSASMNFGKPFKKAEYASMIGIGFAYMGMRNNERFVVSTFSDKLDLFRPARGGRQLASIVEYLNKKKPQGVSNFEESLLLYHKTRVHSKSLVVIISDFLYDLEQIKQVLYRFKDHFIVLVQVLDKTETTLDVEGEFRLKDSESGNMMRTFISPFVRKRYMELMEEHQERIKDVCGEVNARFFVSSTDENIYDTFFRILRG